MVATHAYGGRSILPSAVCHREVQYQACEASEGPQFEMEENRGVGTMERKVEGHSVAMGHGG